MTNNVVLEKAFAFALRIIRMNRYLTEEKKEYVLNRELLISGTHIGRHIKEAISAESKQIFVSEFGVARRKAAETEYWLQLLLHAELISQKEFESIELDRVEVIKLINSIISTARKNV